MLRQHLRHPVPYPTVQGGSVSHMLSEWGCTRQVHVVEVIPIELQGAVRGTVSYGR